MYQYNNEEKQFIRKRALQFEHQVSRFRNGELGEENFTQLRLRNGVYLQRHAHMLRVAIPYGQLNSAQLQKLAEISRKYDKGYGHFTTRQNIQFNWPELDDVPEILKELAEVEMHAIQTSGSCIRNITTDHLAGVSTDEVEDPRPWCELIRQWSTLHPEFNWLPRKFKIAVTGASSDRTALKFHDIGIQIKQIDGSTYFDVWAGGGMGRTPVVGKLLRENLPDHELLAYLQATIRVYNKLGRRDNKYKARIKILVNEMGIEKFRQEVNLNFKNHSMTAPKFSLKEIDRLKACFSVPDILPDPVKSNLIPVDNKAYRNWLEHNISSHKLSGYSVVHVPLKAIGETPGDMTAETMESLASITRNYSRDEIRVTHEQNLILPFIQNEDLYKVWHELDQLNLASPNIGKLTDMIACPGLDYCSLANASTIPLAKEIGNRIDSYDKLYEIGNIKLKMSGCMNACGHHHAGHIGILGVDKKGEEWYQITLGGSAEFNARIGERLGPAVHRSELTNTIEKLLDTYIEIRLKGETFQDTVLRAGTLPFKEKIYANTERSKINRQPVAA